MEVGVVERIEPPHSLEKPRNTVTVTFPDVTVGNAVVKLGMHTDSMLTLLRTLGELQETDISQLRLEGRVLTQEQKDLLQEHPAFRFFMSSRFVRSSEGEVSLALPADLRTTQENIFSWLQTPFSPSSLAAEIGYRVGFFDAQALVRDWIDFGRPNNFLPNFAGTNQFQIGSDTLPQGRLVQIQARLQRAFLEQEQTSIPTLSPIALSSFKLIPLSNIAKFQKENLNFKINKIDSSNYKKIIKK